MADPAEVREKIRSAREGLEAFHKNQKVDLTPHFDNIESALDEIRGMDVEKHGFLIEDVSGFTDLLTSYLETLRGIYAGHGAKSMEDPKFHSTLKNAVIILKATETKLERYI